MRRGLQLPRRRPYNGYGWPRFFAPIFEVGRDLSASHLTVPLVTPSVSIFKASDDPELGRFFPFDVVLSRPRLHRLISLEGMKQPGLFMTVQAGNTMVLVKPRQHFEPGTLKNFDVQRDVLCFEGLVNLL